MKNQNYWQIERDIEKNIDVLLVYQTKLSSLPKDKRWKPNSIYFDGQIETYSPRNGFVDLMLDRGFGLEDISTLLGHSDIIMTWRHYKDKFTFKLPSAG